MCLAVVGTGLLLWAKEPVAAPYVPNAKNFDRWVKFIRPNSRELSFEQIGWRNQFWPAVQQARELGRPVLLWTMNGHPLGCT